MISRRDILRSIPLIPFLGAIKPNQSLIWFTEGVVTSDCPQSDIPGMYFIKVDQIFGKRGTWEDKHDILGKNTLVCGFENYKPKIGDRLRYALIETLTPCLHPMKGGPPNGRWREIVDDHLWMRKYKSLIFSRGQWI